MNDGWCSYKYDLVSECLDSVLFKHINGNNDICFKLQFLCYGLGIQLKLKPMSWPSWNWCASMRLYAISSGNAWEQHIQSAIYIKSSNKPRTTCYLYKIFQGFKNQFFHKNSTYNQLYTSRAAISQEPHVICIRSSKGSITNSSTRTAHTISYIHQEQQEAKNHTCNL